MILYVRPDGDDDNSGLTPDEPLATIAAALAKLGAGSDVGVVDLGVNVTHILTEGVTIDATRHELRGGARCVIDCTAMTSGAAITVMGDPPAVGNRTARVVLVDVELVGPGAGSSVDGVLFADANGGVYHIGPTRVHASHFRRAFCYGEHSWAITLSNCTAHSNGVALWDPSGLAAAGERYTFVSCTFFNNTRVLQAADDGAGFMFVACSFTYNGDIAVLSGGAKAFLSDCHIEDSDTNPNVMFTITNDWGYLSVRGGVFMIEGSTPIGSRTRPAYVSTTDAKVLFADVWMQNIGLASGTFATGTVEVRGTHFPSTATTFAKLIDAGQNLLYDGSFEQAGVFDAWAIVADTAPITDRLNGANIDLSRSTVTARTGTGSLRIHKNNLAGAAKAALFVPVQPGRPMSWELYVSVPSADQGAITYRAAWAIVDRHGYRELETAQQSDISKPSTAPLAWTVKDSGARWRVPPPWATHLVISLDLGAWPAAAVYVDDVTVCAW